MAMSLLVVEDDAFSRTTLSSSLEHQGFAVHPCATAAEASALGMQQPFDGAVLDLHLGPGPTGLDLAKALRRAQPSIGLVLLTSFPDTRLLVGSLAELPAGTVHLVKQNLSDMRLLTAAIDSVTASDGNDAAKPSSDDTRIPLSDGQVDTLRLLASGLTNAEIAQLRTVTLRSTEKAIARIARALNVPAFDDVNQRVALAVAYYRMSGRLG